MRGFCFPPALARPLLLCTDALQQRVELSGIDRLDQMMIESGSERAAAIFVLAPARDGDEHNRAAPGFAADLVRHFVAIELGHADIEQGNIGLELPGKFERVTA